MIQKVRWLNHWIDDMLLALAPLLMKIGFVAGAIDILMSGVFSANSLFQYGWAFTQAISVDAIFFVVLNAFWRTKDKVQRWWFACLIVLYGVTAFFIVNVTAFEQLLSVNSNSAMRSLDIAPQVFTYVRSALVIVSAVLFYLVENLTNEHQRTETANANEQRTNANERPNVPALIPNENERNANGENSVVIQEAPMLQLPQPTSEEDQIKLIITTNPGIGPAELARQMGWGSDRAKAFRLLKKVKNGG